MNLISLKTELRQELKLTPQLLQSMEVLQMNSQELLDYLGNLSEENPTLELSEASELRSAYAELQQKASWLDAGTFGTSFAHEEDAPPEPGATDKELDSLSAFLCDQLERKRLPKPMLALCKYMAELVDEDGYLTQEDLDGLTEMKIPQTMVDQALDAIQSLEPAGVGARDLSECLVLQLSRRKDNVPYAMDIAARFLTELSRSHYGPITKALGASISEIQAAEKAIAALDPHPGQAFQPAEPTLYVRPDVFIVELEGELQVLLNEYYLIVLLFFPFLLGYGISAKMGIFYWINMILACLIFPVVPLVYAAVLTMLVMRLFKNIRNKDFLSYLGFAASLIFAIGINVFSRSIGNFEMQDIMNLMESQKGTLRAFRTIFPNLPLMTGSLADASFLKMILYIATTAVILAVFFALAWKIYLPAVLGMSETTSEKRILSKEEVTRTVKSKNPVRTYAMIEWKKLYRTPAWFMNCVLMPLIWPVFMLGIAFISIISSLGMAKTTGLWTRLVADGTIFRLLKGELPVAVAVLTAAGIAVMMSMFCVISATAMSRKGSEYIYMKCIPMSYHDQIRAMLVSGILISLLGTLPYALAFNIIAVVFGLHPATLLYTTAITVLFTLFVNYEQLLFDLAFPKLNWENETAAIKSNNRSLISVLIDLTVGAILIGAGYLLYGKLHLNIHITTSVMILLTAVLTFAMRTALFKWGVQVMEHLESA